MPFSIDDNLDPNNLPLGTNIRQAINILATQVKQLSGKQTWRTKPDYSITTAIKGEKGDTGATGDKGDTGATGATGAKGDKGNTEINGEPGLKGDKGDPAPLDHRHAIAQVEGLQAALDSKSQSQIITSASVPSNPTQGLIWNEIDSNGALVETWSWTNSQWRSAYKILHTSHSGNGSGGINFNSAFCFDDRYNIWLDKAILKISNFVTITSTNQLTWHLLRSQFATIHSVTINSLGNYTNYNSIININQTFNFNGVGNNANLFINRINVASGTYHFYATTSFMYQLIRK